MAPRYDEVLYGPGTISVILQAVSDCRQTDRIWHQDYDEAV